jgi:chloramphenicol-sensitive protein RarD
MTLDAAPTPSRGRAGLLYAFGAYVLWGVFPLYWKQLGRVPAIEILAHRMVWSCAFTAVLIGWHGRWGEVRAALSARRTLIPLLASTTLVSANWFLYIWAVGHGRVSEASLGYYVNPLFNVLLGRLVLGERLRPAAIVAVLLASAAVLYLAVGQGTVPWVALGLAVTFGLYGLVRKQAPVEPLVGLAVEVALVAPLALLFLGGRFVDGVGAFPAGTAGEMILLAGSGAATAIPLLLFAMAAKRLRLSTLGIVQYFSPSVQLLIAVAVFGEPFTGREAVTFGLIWIAVALYAIDGVRAASRAAAPVEVLGDRG